MDVQKKSNEVYNFPSVADIKNEEIKIYHGSYNFFDHYDIEKAKINGGALYGLGQYFHVDENKAKEYAELSGDTPYLIKDKEYRGNKNTSQKVLYEGTLDRNNMKSVILPEKLTDEHYDILIKNAPNTAIKESLEKIKASGKERYIDLYQWLRKKENVVYMQSVGINGIYNEKRGILTLYDTSKQNIKIKEALVLEGTQIPQNLVKDNSIIKIQERMAQNEKDFPNIKEIQGLEFKNTNKDLSIPSRRSVEISESTIQETSQKLEQKLAVRGTESTVKLSAQQMTKQKGIIARAAAANTKFDKAVDAAVDRGTRALNNTKVGKAYEKAAQTVSGTAVAKTVGKTVKKVTQKAAQTVMGKAVTKIIAKVTGSAVGKSVLKKIPLVSLGAGTYFAWNRFKDGDWKGACGELASGALGCFPGVGTAASTAVDIGLATKDISSVVKNSPQNNTEIIKTEKTQCKVPKKIKEEIDKRGRLKTEKRYISASNIEVQMANKEYFASRE